MMRTRLLALAAGVALLLAACGGGGGTPDEITLTVQPTSPLGAAVSAEQVAAVLKSRAEVYSGKDAAVAVDDTTDPPLFTVTMSGIDQTSAEALLTRSGVLDFRRPLLTPDGLIRCKTADGKGFAVPPTLVNPDPVSGLRARCFTASAVGNPIWETATIADAAGAPQTITNDSVEPNSWVVIDAPQPGMSAKFTSEGAALLQEVTAALRGYPLGIFLDSELIGAPVIRRAITNGEPVISGFDLNQARIYAAVLDGGPLPAQLQVVQGHPL